MNIHIETIMNLLSSNTITRKMQIYNDCDIKLKYFIGTLPNRSANGIVYSDYDLIIINMVIADIQQFEEMREHKLEFENLYCPIIVSLKIENVEYGRNFIHITSKYTKCVMQSKIERNDVEYEGCLFVS